MNALAKTETGALSTMTEPELMRVLQASLYPGAAHESIKLVLGYCKAAGLDPMQKPVHIVPMWDGKAKQMRDVIMPGVGLYRTQASRTERFAGQSEPEFGPMVTQKIGGVEITYPEWARVTVKKLMANGTIAEFTACEYWLENYAVKGGQEKSIAPNAMWFKRPRGQIAKCAAAQALRLAFPEMGAQPTAEEMEGKPLDEQPPERHMGAAEVVQPAPQVWPDDVFAKQLPKFRKAVADGKSVDEIIAWAETKGVLTAAQKEAIRGPVAEAQPAMTFAAVAEQLTKAADRDALAIAADLIRFVADDKQRDELAVMFEKLDDEMA